jgi:hypothetical protein
MFRKIIDRLKIERDYAREQWREMDNYQQGLYVACIASMFVTSVSCVYGSVYLVCVGIALVALTGMLGGMYNQYLRDEEEREASLDLGIEGIARDVKKIEER